VASGSRIGGTARRHADHVGEMRYAGTWLPGCSFTCALQHRECRIRGRTSCRIVIDALLVSVGEPSSVAFAVIPAV